MLGSEPGQDDELTCIVVVIYSYTQYLSCMINVDPLLLGIVLVHCFHYLVLYFQVAKAILHQQ